MKLTKWKIRNEVYSFPSEWDKEKVLKFVNANYIKVCHRCGKVDISLRHFEECNIVEEQQRQLNNEYYD